MKRKTYQIVVSETDDNAPGDPPEQVESFQVTPEQVEILILAAGGFQLKDEEKESARPLIVRLLRHHRPATTAVTS